MVPFFVNQLTGSFNAIAVTSVTAIYSGLQFLGAPVIGRLSDRWGRRGILTIAVGISALALIGQGLSTSLTMLLLFSALNGASSGVFAISQAMVADAVEDRDQRTVGFGAIGAALGLGFIIGQGLEVLSGLVRAIRLWWRQLLRHQRDPDPPSPSRITPTEISVRS